ncbi:MAG: hypothetical protein ACRDXE_01115 [Acidimicrobiales bacterium]
MRRSGSRLVLALAFAVGGLLLAAASGAWAVSAGGYSPSQQDCPPNAARNNAPNGTTVAGCHNVAVNVESGHTRYAEVGLDQLPQGYPTTPGLLGLGYPGAPNFPHSGCIAANTNGTGGGTGKGCGQGKGTGFTLLFNTENPGGNQLTVQHGTPNIAGGAMALLANGVKVYFGQDDNTDAGEHDGVSGNNGTAGSINGPSDGGGIGLAVTPSAAGQTPTATNPVPVANGQAGGCADGLCVDATTSRQSVYKGCGANPSVPCGPNSANGRDAYNYQGKQWDPYNCSSGTAQSEAPGPQGCGSQTMDQYRAQEARNVYAEPGVQVYEDPDPQGSPAAPVYPIPSAYAGTCGVAAGGGQAPAAPASPVTNSAGQVVVSPTGC